MSALTTNTYINIAAYIANVAVTYGIGVAGLFGLPSNSELSEKYQSLVTPAGFTFSIWAVIFLSQAIFAIANLVPSIVNSQLVQEGVGYSYLAVCISQIAWTVAFANEIIWLSLIFMLMILFFLVSIVMSQYDLRADGWKDYFLLKFPFTIHCGWIIAASFVNASVVLVSYKVDPDLQFYVALGTLVGVLVIAGFLLTYPLKIDYVIPLVLAWATLGIYLELRDPAQLILVTFEASKIATVKNGALIFFSVIAIAILMRVILGNQKQETSSAATVATSPLRADEENVYVRTDDTGARME